MASTQNQQASETKFFNLHVSGVGYLNRVRWVTPNSRGGRRSEPFLACSVAALRGNSDDPAYTYFDFRVSGEEAIAIVGDLEKAVTERRKVFVTFRAGDLYPHLYERDVRDSEGKPTGRKEMAVLIKGRLLVINSVTIDGDRVYTREAEQEQPGNDDLPGDGVGEDNSLKQQPAGTGSSAVPSAPSAAPRKELAMSSSGFDDFDDSIPF
ncbi:DUF3577 domain-containing protein [Variovorax sp. ZS18.2.2]|uniref:DUF3577 domain-containing protein n=1 Tax=Variovorax sp. ZS18.2.2 TaxID=2971255 RepID=UPI002151719E|nr:DUF3577 domain-containing protein [Variovorax sp. ZS18.2.2]MCR6481054.1 DUF3577 domain-containing protein [Variovorax sp. ZS18.2.2]